MFIEIIEGDRFLKKKIPQLLSWKRCMVITVVNELKFVFRLKIGVILLIDFADYCCDHDHCVDVAKQGVGIEVKDKL